MIPIDESFSEEEELLEEELSLSSFLKTNSDILTSEESAPISEIWQFTLLSSYQKESLRYSYRDT